ncbi:hypothetical protein [Frankia sp. Cr2]|uniref:hypothetical protein n=1 Tax=Frankia sp. Cr2 TaxID=3073932 RepID=UPI002AD3BF2A|nr:hypothetical protein [Frankia sp. Cr2]
MHQVSAAVADAVDVCLAGTQRAVTPISDLHQPAVPTPVNAAGPIPRSVVKAHADTCVFDDSIPHRYAG